MRRLAETTSARKLQRRSQVGCPIEEHKADKSSHLLEHAFDKVSRRIKPESLSLGPQPIRSCLRKGDQAPHSAPELRRRVSWALPERIEVEVTPTYASKGTPFQLAKFFDCHDGFVHCLKDEEASEVAKSSEVDVLRAALFEQSDEMDGASTDIDEESESDATRVTETEDSASDAEEVSEVQSEPYSEVPEVEEEEVEDMGLDDEDETSLTLVSLDTWTPQKPTAPRSTLGTTWMRPSDRRRRPQPVSIKSCWYERTPGQH